MQAAIKIKKEQPVTATENVPELLQLLAQKDQSIEQIDPALEHKDQLIEERNRLIAEQQKLLKLLEEQLRLVLYPTLNRATFSTLY